MCQIIPIVHIYTTRRVEITKRLCKFFLICNTLFVIFLQSS
uniref:Uncharacterized protein n=1 Tax=Dulem virus 42 TaxID=3145760 RepID=A0AAU8B9Q6_9CAUD